MVLVGLVGCGDTSPSATHQRPDSWRSTVTSASHDAVRIDTAEATLVLTKSPPTTAGARFTALRAAAIAAIGIPDSLRVGEQEDWQLRVLQQAASHAHWSHGSARELLATTAEAGPRDAESMRAMLREPAIAAQPLAAAVVRNNLGCVIIDDALMHSDSDQDFAAALLLAASEFSGVCQVPEGPLNEAAVWLSLARLDPDRAAERVRNAGAALARLNADASGCPMIQDEFLGVGIAGQRIAYVLDSSLSMDGPVLEALKLAVIDSIRSLSPSTSFMVAFFGDVASVMPNPNGATLSDGMILRGGPVEPFVTTLAACEQWLRAHAASGDTVPLSAMTAAVALRPSTVFLLTDGLIEDPSGELLQLAKKLHETGGRIEVIILDNPQLRDAGWTQSQIESVPAGLAAITGGSLHVMGGPSSASTASSAVPHAATFDGFGPLAALSGESVRNRAVRNGSWTPMVERQFHAVSSEYALWNVLLDPSVSVPESVVLSLHSALDPLRPDPLTAEIGPARQDWRLLMREGAARCASGDLDAGSSFLEAAEILATLAADFSLAGDDAHSDVARELGARAVLLSELCGAPPLSRSSAMSARAKVESLGLGSDTWSARLIDAAAGGIADARAGFRLDPTNPNDALALEELAAIRVIYGRSTAVVTPNLALAPITDRTVFARALVRAASATGNP